MIAKLRQILGLQTVQEKLERYALLKGEMDEINERTDFLAEEYISRLNGYNTLLKSDCSPEIKDSVQKRYANFMDGQKKQVIGLVNQRHRVEKSIASILKDEKIKDAVSEFELLEKAKSNYKSGIISKGVYNDIIKAKKGKVHYSDNFVFWNGKLLLIQRATDDDGANKWGVPGGHVDAGETHEQAAIRELQEETGLVVENPILAGTYQDDNAMIEYYTSTIESDTEPQLVLDTAEHQSYRWVDLHKEGIDEFEFPFNMKENIKKLLLPKEERPQNISKAVNMFIDGFISKDVLSDIVKARSGIYENTPENRKLGRVGQRYGGKKESEKKETKETNFSYSNKDFLLAMPEDDGKDIESTINEFVSNITGDKSDRVGSQYYRTGKKIEGKDVVIRVSDHSHSERNVLGSEYLVSIVVDEDESSHSRVEDDYSELVVSERNMDDALEAIQEFFDKVEAGHKKTVSKSLTDLFFQGVISKDVLEKARSGVYADNAKNRRLKRVGQKYGSSGMDGKEGSDKTKEQEDTKEKPKGDRPLDEYAKETSETALQEAAKGGDEELRLAAKKELDRREKEESIKEGEGDGELSFEKDESGKLGNNYNLKQGQKTIGFLETKERDDSIEIMKVKLDEDSRGKGLYLEFLLKLLNEKGKPIVSRNTDRNELSDKVWEKLKNRKDVVVSETKIGGDESLKLSLNKEGSSSDQPEKENVSADTEKKTEEEVPSSDKKEGSVLTEKEIRDSMRVLDEKMNEISDKIDEEHKGASFLTRAKEKRKNPEYTKYNKEFEDLKEQLIKIKESKPKVKNIEEDTGYKMFHRPNEDGAPSYDLTDGEISLPKDFYENPEMYGNIKDKTYKESLDALKKIKGDPEAEITIYRATPSKEINDGDWVTLSKEYANIHNESSLDGNGNILEMKVKAKNLKFAGDDIREFGYFKDK